jgi:hypothetical protein
MKFNYKAGDVLSFEDTDSEYVDVGLGGENMKVAEYTYPNIVIVRKCGRGHRLELEYNYSEIFKKYPGKGKFDQKKYISLKEFIDYFGTFNELKYECTEEELKGADLPEIW